MIQTGKIQKELSNVDKFFIMRRVDTFEFIGE